MLYRDGRNVELTVYGEDFYEYVQAALETLDGGVAALRKRKEELGGVINLGTAFTTLDDYLHPLLNKFSVEHGSNVHINVFQGFTNFLTQGLHNKIFDVVFCGKREGETEIEYYPVLYRELILCVRDDHPFAERDIISFDDLRRQQLYTYHRGTPIGEQVYELVTRHELEKVSLDYDDDITMASFLSFTGDAAALMLDSIGLKLFSNLKTIPVKEVPKRFYWVYLAYHKRFVRSSTVDAFIHFVKDYELNAVKDL